MDRKRMTRYLLAVYLIVAFVAIILGLVAFNHKNDIWQAMLLNLSTELIGVVFIFFLVNYLFLIDDWNLSERIENLLTRLEFIDHSSVKKSFLVAFPDELQREIEVKLQEANDILILGVVLTNTLDLHYHLFEAKLKNGQAIRVVIVDPNNPACAMTALRKYRQISTEVWHGQVQSSLNTLQELKAKNLGDLEIRIIDFPLANGGIYIDPNGSQGTYFLWYHGFKTRKDNLPKFVVRSTDEYWYKYFQEEANAIWDYATPWEG